MALPSVSAGIAFAILLLEVAAAAVILYAAAIAIARFAHRAATRARPAADRALRHDFARSLLLGLDFAIGSDVLRVARAPGLEAAGLAALVVAVRIALTLILERELASPEA